MHDQFNRSMSDLLTIHLITLEVRLGGEELSADFPQQIL